MRLDFTLLQTHIFAKIRDSYGNRMPIAERIECCLHVDCLVVYEGTQIDYHYMKLGAPFLVFKHQKLIKLAGDGFSYENHQELEDGMDRFDLSSYTFCHLLKRLDIAKRVTGTWHQTSIDRELEQWLRYDVVSPQVLSFIGSTEGHQPVYRPQIFT